MGIGSIFSSSFSGLRAAVRRLNVSAHNTANINTDGFKAKQVTQQSHPEGGVETHIVPVHDPGPIILRDGHFIEGSNTNLITETVGRIEALQAYRANIAVMKTAEELSKTTLDEL